MIEAYKLKRAVDLKEPVGKAGVRVHIANADREVCGWKVDFLIVDKATAATTNEFSPAEKHRRVKTKACGGVVCDGRGDLADARTKVGGVDIHHGVWSKPDVLAVLHNDVDAVYVDA